MQSYDCTITLLKTKKIIISFLKIGMVLYLHKFESLSPRMFFKIVQSLAEIGQIVLDKKILESILTMYFCLPLEKGMALHLNKLESSSPKNILWQVWLKLYLWFWRSKKMKMWKVYNNNSNNNNRKRTNFYQKSLLEFQLRWAHKFYQPG